LEPEVIETCGLVCKYWNGIVKKNSERLFRFDN